MIQTCRSCTSNKLISVFNLGNQYVSDFVTSSDPKPEQSALELVMCKECSLIQLKNTVSPLTLYTDHYGYYSGINDTMRSHLRGIVESTASYVKLYEKDVVIDIGSNDATLLKNYPDKLLRIGFDPVKKFREYYQEGNLIHAAHFFESSVYWKILEQIQYPKQKAKIITAISMFYDLDDPNKFLREVREVLHEEGIFVIQQNYLVSMLQNNAFDNIVHEHLEYYSLTSLERLLIRHGLEIADAEVNDLNGGSFRVYVKHMKMVRKLRLLEQKMKINNQWTYVVWAMKIKNIKKRVYEFIKEVVGKGKTVYVYGASTRGNTLLQYFDLDNTLIKAAVERNPDKWGKKIASVDIPIISEEQARKDKPDVLLVLPWFFLDEFLKREKEYLKQGGKFLVPLPEFKVITYENISSNTNSKT